MVPDPGTISPKPRIMGPQTPENECIVGPRANNEPIVPGFVDPEQPKLLRIPFTQYCLPSYIRMIF